MFAMGVRRLSIKRHPASAQFGGIKRREWQATSAKNISPLMPLQTSVLVQTAVNTKTWCTLRNTIPEYSLAQQDRGRK